VNLPGCSLIPLAMISPTQERAAPYCFSMYWHSAMLYERSGR